MIERPDRNPLSVQHIFDEFIEESAGRPKEEIRMIYNEYEDDEVVDMYWNEMITIQKLRNKGKDRRNLKFKESSNRLKVLSAEMSYRTGLNNEYFRKLCDKSINCKFYFEMMKPRGMPTQ